MASSADIRFPDSDCCTLPVVERFVSINGEGPRAGRLAAFIRFAGCNLACSWCDTSWANVGNCAHEDCAPDELVEWVAGSGAACVTLTGGEPALQPGLPDLIRALHCSDVWGAGLGAQRVVEVETNGAVDLASLDALRNQLAEGRLVGAVAGDAREAGRPTGLSGQCSAAAPGPRPEDLCQSEPGVQPEGSRQSGLEPAACVGDGGCGCQVHFTVDCKMPSSGMDAEMLPGNYELLRWGDAVKFVVASREDLECAQRVIERHDLCDRCEVFFSPVFSCIEPSQIVDFMQEQRLSRVRLQLQLHKIIWPGQEKGV